jgi:copper(I)-binding protein
MARYLARFFVVRLLAGFGAGQTALADQTAGAELQVHHPWARASLGAHQTGAAYFTLVNFGSAADRLIAVSTPAAERAQLHGHSMDDQGVMKMRPVDGIEAPPKSETSLEPGGLHVMLMGLRAPLKEGESIALTLRFEQAGEIDVTVTILAPGAMGPAHHHQGHGSDAGHEPEHKHGQGHGHHAMLDLPADASAPVLSLTAEPDAVGGWNLHLTAENFRFAPENVNSAHQAGQGHAHLYVDGKKVARLYGPWYHLGKLAPGEHELKITLNANDHRPLAVDGVPLTAAVTVVAGAMEHQHAE